MIRIIFFALVMIFVVCFVYFLLGRINWHRSTPYAFLFLPIGLIAYYLDYPQTALIASVAGLAFLVYGFLMEDVDSNKNEEANSQE